VIFILGLEMVLGIELFQERAPMQKASVGGCRSPFPLIGRVRHPLTTIMSLKSQFRGPQPSLLGILLNLVFIFVVLKSMDMIERSLGPGGHDRHPQNSSGWSSWRFAVKNIQARI